MLIRHLFDDKALLRPPQHTTSGQKAGMLHIHTCSQTEVQVLWHSSVARIFPASIQVHACFNRQQMIQTVLRLQIRQKIPLLLFQALRLSDK